MTPTEQTLADAKTNALELYEKALAEERTEAKRYSAALQIVHEVGRARRKVTSQARYDAYEAYTLALKNCDAGKATT